MGAQVTGEEFFGSDRLRRRFERLEAERDEAVALAGRLDAELVRQRSKDRAELIEEIATWLLREGVVTDEGGSNWGYVFGRQAVTIAAALRREFGKEAQ